MSEARPSLPHLKRHQRDVDTYRHNVATSAQSRFGPVWWGIWDHHLGLRPDATIVDLGTGPATLLALLRARYPDARLFGVELHPKLLEMARQTVAASDVTLVEADLALPVPLPDASADVVVSALTLHELPYPPDLLTNAARLLRPGGKLVLMDIVKWPLGAYLQDRGLSRDTLDHYREHCLFTADDLAWLVGNAGLQVDEVVMREGGRFAVVVAQKPA